MELFQKILLDLILQGFSPFKVGYLESGAISIHLSDEYTFVNYL